jgi:hypothetical protein
MFYGVIVVLLTERQWVRALPYLGIMHEQDLRGQSALFSR